MTDTPILLIDRGDLPSLAAAMTETSPERMILWHFLEPDLAGTRRKQVCEAHVDQLGARRLIVIEPGAMGLSDMPPPKGMFQALMLLQAAATARQLNCSKIVWPRQVGPEFEPMGLEIDRADAAMSLAAEDPEMGPLAIDLPLIDLTDQQVAELVEEAGGALDLFWPCEESQASPCGTCKECTRWQKAFQAARVLWPWEAAIALEASFEHSERLGTIQSL